MDNVYLSACVITREAPAVLEAVACVAPHVDEVVVVDTGSSDAWLKVLREAVAKHGNVRVERYTDCLDADGRMADFSAARARSFALARGRWVAWLDSDDVVRGAEGLRATAQRLDAQRPQGAVAVLCPYEYAYHADGRVACLHYRERLLRGPADFRWECPVHEVCVPVRPEVTHSEVCEDMVWEHRRARGGVPEEPGRNLRIMRAWVQRTPDAEINPRQLYYLGQELHDAGGGAMAAAGHAAANGRQQEAQEHAARGNALLSEAEQTFSRYIGVSGWDDERVMAGLRLVTLCLARSDFAQAIHWARTIVDIKDEWGECWFALGKAYYLRALAGGPSERQDWERAVRNLQRGLACPPTRTVLFVDPRERAVVVHEHLCFAANKIGMFDLAAASCAEGLRAEPSNGNLAHNKALFDRMIAMRTVAQAVDAAVSASACTQDQALAVAALLNGSNAALTWEPAKIPVGYPAKVAEEARPVARVTPHEQAWGIPQSFAIDGLPLRMTEAQLRSLVLALWHELMLHDEILAAESLLRQAPVRVRNDPGLALALDLTLAGTRWMDSHAGQQEINQPADPTVETGTPLPAPFTGAAGVRLSIVLDRLKPGETVLDLGCFDGGFTNRIGLAGHKVLGVDLCETSVALANRKAAEFNTGAHHVISRFEDALVKRIPEADPGTFDALTCTDTWEHVRDVDVLVQLGARYLRDGGRFLLTTPHGAWMRGKVIDWAHPWRYGADKGKPWISDEPRAHLIAPTPADVAVRFRREDGWRVRHCYVIDSPCPDTPGQGWVFLEAERVAQVAAPRKRVVFVLGQCWERWTPWTAEQHGIGGSETAVIQMAQRLARAGYDVTVYGDTGREGEGIYDGVQYLHHDRLGADPATRKEVDVLVAWRNADLLRALPAKVRLLWVHDIYAYNATNANLLLADAVLGLSEWHCGFLRQHHNLAASHVVRTRNGVDPVRFAGAASQRDPHKVVYTSSPDRALPMLLRCWPAIRAAVPDATLHVFYGFDGWRRALAARGEPPVADQIEAQARAMADQGVVLRGRVEQSVLAQEMLGSGAWLYPTWFSETSCIGAMEAQCAGLHIVTSPIAALPETAPGAVFVDGDGMSDDYAQRFTAEAIKTLTDEGRPRPDMLAARRAHDWSAVAREWQAMIEVLLAQPKHERLHRYMPYSTEAV